jgi:hypothetical protein
VGGRGRSKAEDPEHGWQAKQAGRIFRWERRARNLHNSRSQLGRVKFVADTVNHNCLGQFQSKLLIYSMLQGISGSTVQFSPSDMI